MPSALIRSAAPADFEHIARLLEELGRSPVVPQHAEHFRTTYLRHLARADTSDIVAVQDDQIVGFLSLEFRERLNRSTLEAWIPDLIVTSSARGHGYGRQLLEAALHLARSRGCHCITLESGYQRTIAHQLYTNSGMVNAGYYFTYPLINPE